jgi:abortive infection bacteriophage resistance protein
MKHLISDKREWNEFVENINTLVSKYPYVNIHLMGFTEDWIPHLLK